MTNGEPLRGSRWRAVTYRLAVVTKGHLQKPATRPPGAATAPWGLGVAPRQIPWTGRCTMRTARRLFTANRYRGVLAVRDPIAG
jgi:hypothetical protein